MEKKVDAVRYLVEGVEAPSCVKVNRLVLGFAGALLGHCEDDDRGDWRDEKGREMDAQKG